MMNVIMDNKCILQYSIVIYFPSFMIKMHKNIPVFIIEVAINHCRNLMNLFTIDKNELPSIMGTGL